MDYSFSFLYRVFWNLGIWWLIYSNRAINVIMIITMIMTIIKIIIIVILLQLLIMEIMKIKMMLIKLILVRHSSRNKVKILGRNFISKDLILTSFFIRPGSPKKLFLRNLLRQQTIPNTGAEFN